MTNTRDANLRWVFEALDNIVDNLLDENQDFNALRPNLLADISSAKGIVWAEIDEWEDE
jgi:hypothetical protein